ncbi:MAG: hypothetical protein V1898_00885 [Patescibacteria group bacterium]
MAAKEKSRAEGTTNFFARESAIVPTLELFIDADDIDTLQTAEPDDRAAILAETIKKILLLEIEEGYNRKAYKKLLDERGRQAVSEIAKRLAARLMNAVPSDNFKAKAILRRAFSSLEQMIASLPEERNKIIAQAKPDTPPSPAEKERDAAEIIIQRLEQRTHNLRHLHDRQKPQTVSKLELKARQTAFSEMLTLSEDSSEYKIAQKKLGLLDITEGRPPAYIKSVDIPILSLEKKVYDEIRPRTQTLIEALTELNLEYEVIVSSATIEKENDYMVIIVKGNAGKQKMILINNQRGNATYVIHADPVHVSKFAFFNKNQLRYCQAYGMVETVAFDNASDWSKCLPEILEHDNSEISDNFENEINSQINRPPSEGAMTSRELSNKYGINYHLLIAAINRSLEKHALALKINDPKQLIEWRLNANNSVMPYYPAFVDQDLTIEFPQTEYESLHPAEWCTANEIFETLKAEGIKTSDTAVNEIAQQVWSKHLENLNIEANEKNEELNEDEWMQQGRSNNPQGWSFYYRRGPLVEAIKSEVRKLKEKKEGFHTIPTISQRLWDEHGIRAKRDKVRQTMKTLFETDNPDYTVENTPFRGRGDIEQCSTALTQAIIDRIRTEYESFPEATADMITLTEAVRIIAAELGIDATSQSGAYQSIRAIGNKSIRANNSHGGLRRRNGEIESYVSELILADMRQRVDFPFAEDGWIELEQARNIIASEKWIDVDSEKFKALASRINIINGHYRDQAGKRWTDHGIGFYCSPEMMDVYRNDKIINSLITNG